MTEVAAAAAPPEKQFQPRRLVIWFVSIVVIGGVVYLLGWDIRGWFSQLWDTLTQVSAKYLDPGARAPDFSDPLHGSRVDWRSFATPTRTQACPRDRSSPAMRPPWR